LLANKVDKLKKISNDINILYIDNELASQNKIAMFANKIFNNVYKAYDGYDGLEKFKKFEPDIVIVSLSLNSKNSIEIICDIRNINSDVKIIVVSKRYHPDIELLKSIDLGVEIIYKPIDLSKMSMMLLDTIQTTQKYIEKTKVLKYLKTISSGDNNFEFINSYKGIPIHNDGMIVNILGNEIIVQVPKIQLVAMRYEMHTIIGIKNKNRFIKADIAKIDFTNSILTLISPRYINFKIDEYKNQLMNVDKSFNVSLHFHHRNIDVVPLYISSDNLILFTKNSQDLKITNEIDLTFIYQINSTTTLVNDKKIVKGFAKGMINKIEPYKNGYKIFTSYNIKKADERTLNRYLKELEINIIQEFKKLIKKGIT